MAVSDMWAPSDESFSSVISSCETWPVSYHTDDRDLCCSCCRNSPLEHCRALVTDHNHRTVLRSPLVSTTDRHHMLSFWHCCVVTTDKQYCDPPTLHPASQLIQIIAALSSAPGIYISLLFLCSSQNMKERHREMLFISCKEWTQIFYVDSYLFVWSEQMWWRSCFWSCLSPNMNHGSYVMGYVCISTPESLQCNSNPKLPPNSKSLLCRGVC